MATRTTGVLVDDHLGQAPAHGGQVLTAAATSGASTALSAGTYRVSSTVACWLRVGESDVEAAETAGNAYLAAGAIDFITVHPDDDNTYLAVIRDTSESSDGKVSLTRCRAH